MSHSAFPGVDLERFDTIFSLDGKVAVVTGGSRGLGLSTASGLLQAGCSKVYISSRKAEACEAAAAALNALPNEPPHSQAIPVAADTSRLSDIEALVSEVGRTTDHVDILFANAGITWGEPFDSYPESAFDRVMDVNVKGVFFVIQKFTPLLEVRASSEDPSRIVIAGSVAGVGLGSIGENGTYAYAASKAAAISLSRNLAVELGPRHILVNAIAPGLYPTKMASGLIGVKGGEDALAKETPNARVGRPEDIAGLVVFLCSRASSHVNGMTIVIDGGKLLAGQKL